MFVRRKFQLYDHLTADEKKPFLASIGFAAGTAGIEMEPVMARLGDTPWTRRGMSRELLATVA